MPKSAMRIVIGRRKEKRCGCRLARQVCISMRQIKAKKDSDMAIVIRYGRMGLRGIASHYKVVVIIESVADSLIATTLFSVLLS